VITFETAEPDETEMANRFAAIAGKGHPLLIGEIDGEVIGYAYASTYRPREAYRFTCEDSIYLAPSDYHTMVEDKHLALSTEEVVQYARPSIDVLFESAANSYGSSLIAVILTGANEDGADGMCRVKELGGYTIVQDPSTAEVPYMPRFAREAVPEAEVLTLAAIPVRLRQLTQRAAKGDAA